MPTAQSAYLFLLGFSCGTVLLAFTAYRHVSPLWLRVLLSFTALFMIARYASLAAFATVDDPQRIWILRHCWFASAVGLTLPSVFAVDQLLRHPAMTPRKLLIGYSPFLAVYVTIILFANYLPAPDPVLGWSLKLASGWSLLVSGVQSLFVLTFVSACAYFIRKVPMTAIRVPLGLLALAHLWLAFDGAVMALGRWYFRPFLFSEMFALVCIWYAFESAILQQRS